MASRKIVLKNPDDARALVALAAKEAFDVTVRRGRIQIDAKSIVGVLGMDLKHPMELHYDGDSAELDAFAEAHIA